MCKLFGISIRFFLLILLFSTKFCSAHTNTHSQSMPVIVMYEREFVLSDYYYIEAEGLTLGNIIKTKLSLSTNYQHYNTHGEHTSSAYLRLFSLGTLFTWASVIDLYDAEGYNLGRIDGTLLTLLPSKFHFYDADDCHVAVAYMDQEHMGFSLVAAYNENKIIAQFKRIFVQDVADHWEIRINDPSAIDIRMIFAFGAFAIDHQTDFREDN